MDASAMRIRWRIKKKAPSTELVQTPVTALLRMALSSDGPMFRKRTPSNFPVSYPKSTPRQHQGTGKTKAAGSAAPLKGGLENPITTSISTIKNRTTSTPPTSNRVVPTGTWAGLFTDELQNNP